VSRRVGIVAGVLALVLVALEVAAVPLATRVIGTVVARCVGYDTFEVTSVARPVVPRLLVGRARDVRLQASGVVAGDLRVADARLDLPDAILPWAIGSPEPSTGTLQLRLDEADVERALRQVVPFGGALEVELQPDVATLGSPVVPLTLDLEVAVDPDGTVRLRPVRGGELLERLGIERRFTPGDAARVTDLEIGAGELHGALDVDVVPGIGSGDACDEPLGAATGTVEAVARGRAA
jgi:hypothetical protein